MTDPHKTAGKDSGGSADLPDSDPRNPLDLILKDGLHGGKVMRLYPPLPNALLLPTNLENQPSAPFFCEYRPTDRRDPFTGLRIWQFIGIGIDGGSIKAGKPLPKKPYPVAPSYTKDYPKK